jgi:hypothetical protein
MPAQPGATVGSSTGNAGTSGLRAVLGGQVDGEVRFDPDPQVALDDQFQGQWS